MKKRMVTALVITALTASMIAGCGASAQGTAAEATSSESAVQTEATESAEATEQSVSAASTTVESSVSTSSEEEPVNMEVVSLSNGDKHIYGEMYLPEEQKESYPTVIISHGFGGNTNNNARYAEMFANAGYAALVFDFCGGGPKSQSDGDMTEMSVLTEAADLEAVMDQVKELPYVDGSHLFLMGESQGGFVSSYVAAQRPDEVTGLVLFYPAFVLQREAAERNPDPEHMDETQEVLHQTIGKIYNEDAMSFDIFDVIGNYKGDVLIVHGDNDQIAPLEDSERAVEIYDNATLHVIEKGSHGFNGNKNYMRDAADTTIEFMNAHLAE